MSSENVPAEAVAEGDLSPQSGRAVALPFVGSRGRELLDASRRSAGARKSLNTGSSRQEVFAFKFGAIRQNYLAIFWIIDVSCFYVNLRGPLYVL